MTQEPYYYLPQFLSQAEADALYEHSQALSWQQNDIRMFGKFIPVPRLEAIYGDEGCSYFYSSSVLLEPLPWTDPLAKLRDRIETESGFNFAITTGNRYRVGEHSIGWHSDNEKSLGTSPAIASISLGAIRKFSLKPRKGMRGNYSISFSNMVRYCSCFPVANPLTFINCPRLSNQ
ncbi:alpha-ketoglutarate-dependent dioxygenase AlkB family protein [Leptolyngbya sp. Cla-17]|uniref:alpha-ketoglutarate-dependent dioxygenase AlkB family protein n=1 Tax=Leptolyngbya sp. Cla-17 TaxID=2803751 RepID=UPI001F5D6915|nr:alpha-ketoglutarate-dependent dioxygenase AlkB [Leptolyngbya sp. Cla-17]